MIREELVPVVHAINASGKPVFALDIPSGLDSDTGIAHGEAVRADCTVSFVGLKTGLVIGDGPEYAGTLYFDDLEVLPPAKSGQFSPRLERILERRDSGGAAPASARGSQGRFRQGAHRRQRAEHARCNPARGRGLSASRRRSGHGGRRAGEPRGDRIGAAGADLLCRSARRRSCPKRSIARRSIAVGPGLGRSSWAREALDAVLRSGKPLVIDADALNLVAEAAKKPDLKNCILTPHPGEASRLLGVDTDHVQHDRLNALGSLVEGYGATVVLKGAGTLVGAPSRTPAVCERGNPGMASAGMGDVLTGTIAGILAQCRDSWLAARVGRARACDGRRRSGAQR